MGFTNYQAFLALLQISTGSINTLSTKWADELEAVDFSGSARKFHHPYIQSCAMFIGELLCLFVFKAVYWNLRKRGDGSENKNTLTKGTRQFNPFILYVPAICDMVGTTVMNIGLDKTSASSFQMFRGAVIIFVALLSVAVLRRRLVAREWTGILTIVIGLALVGASDMLAPSTEEHSTTDMITGDMLIFAAQIITAVQMVYEEKYVVGKDIPALQAVGYQGLFGLGTLGVLLIPFYYLNVENTIDAVYQMKNNWQILVAVSGGIVSIAFFNYAGISVTKEISATTRMVLDSVRTLVIWVVSLTFFGQAFQPLQLAGFIFLLLGMCIYNNIVVLQTYRRIRNLFKHDEENVVKGTNDTSHA